MDIEKERLTTFISEALPIAGGAADSIAANFEKRFFGKNDFLLKQGQLSNEYLFLETGFIRAFTYDTEGNEVTINLYAKDAIVFEAASFIMRTPTKENIHALTDCTTWIIKHDDFQILFHSMPEFREFARAILVRGFIALKERTLSMVNHTAEQRYEDLLHKRPDILQNIPLRYIASFLGITDTSLSRIRKEIMEK